MIARTSYPLTPEPDPDRVLAALQDALVEIDVWRQNARTPEEWTALRRLATALALAQQEIFDGARGPVVHSADAAQQSLLPA